MLTLMPTPSQDMAVIFDRTIMDGEANIAKEDTDIMVRVMQNLMSDNIVQDQYKNATLCMTLLMKKYVRPSPSQYVLWFQQLNIAPK